MPGNALGRSSYLRKYGIRDPRGGGRASARLTAPAVAAGAFVPIAGIVPKLEKLMDALRKSGDSCGARLTVVASGVPSGWGEPLYGRLDADIARPGAWRSARASRPSSSSAPITPTR